MLKNRQPTTRQLDKSGGRPEKPRAFGPMGMPTRFFVVSLLLIVSICWFPLAEHGIPTRWDVSAASLQQDSCEELSLLFVGAASGPASDEQIIAFLENSGYDVDATTVDDYDEDDGIDADLVLISRSVIAASVGDMFTTLPTPILTWEGTLYGDLLMTGPVQGTDFGSLSARTTIAITDPNHPIAAGLSGSVETHSSNSAFLWGAPSAGASVVATIDTADEQAAIFAYDAGSQMVGATAPARRVGFHDANFNRLTDDGKLLFQSAVEWAIGCTSSEPPAEYTLTVEIDGQGQVEYQPNFETYQSGDLVVLSAFPEPGWAFSAWSNTITQQNPTFIIFDDQDIVVKASFVSLPTATLTPTVVITPTFTPIITPTAVITPTVAPTAIPTNTPTQVPTEIPTQIPTPTIVVTPTVVITPTVAPTFTVIPTATVAPTLAPTQVITPTVTPTPLIVPTPIVTTPIVPTPIVGGGSGGILRELWYGLEDGSSFETLTTLQDYPENPDDRDILPDFRVPFGFANYYGARIRGYVYPPTTGIYIFYIAADDRGALLLSSDDDAANAVEIAQAPGWTSVDDWDKYPEQQSTVVILEAGKRYYIEAIHVQGSAGDNLSVAWEGPGFGRQLIEGQYLVPFELTEPATPTPAATPTQLATLTPVSTQTPVVTPTLVSATATPIAPEPTVVNATSTPLPNPSPSPAATSQTVPASVQATLMDELYIDNDGDNLVDFGETLKYQLRLANLGTVQAESTVFQLVPSELTNLVVGSVNTSQGSVVRGNQLLDSQVVVNLGSLAPGAEATVTFEVKIVDVADVPSSALENPIIEAQGAVVGLNLSEMSSDDPESVAPSDATVTTLAIETDLEVSKTDLLLLDQDGDGRISPEDQLIYIIRVQNNGLLSAKNIHVVDDLDTNVTLISGTVIASRGTVITGNGVGDNSVHVSIDQIPSDSDIFVRLQAQINPTVTGGQILNQAIVTVESDSGVTGQSRFQSNDPDTATENDPTTTAVFSRSTLFQPQLYLPLVNP